MKDFYSVEYFIEFNGGERHKICGGLLGEFVDCHKVTNEKYVFNDFLSLYQFASKPLRGADIWTGRTLLKKTRTVEIEFRHNKNYSKIHTRIPDGKNNNLFPITIYKEVNRVNVTVLQAASCLTREDFKEYIKCGKEIGFCADGSGE